MGGSYASGIATGKPRDVIPGNGRRADLAPTLTDPAPAVDTGAMPNGGFFITLEGIDGSGTSTQRDLLGEELQRRGLDVHVTAEPSSGPIGRLIRQILRHDEEVVAAALAQLFAADRLDHLAREIEPALERGAVVISDRYVLSSLAYQSIDLPLEYVEEVNSLARVADVTFFLRCSPATAAERRRGRGTPEERFDPAPLQEKVARSYEEALVRPAVGEIEVVDAEASIEAVAAEILGHVDAHLDSLVS